MPRPFGARNDTVIRYIVLSAINSNLSERKKAPRRKHIAFCGELRLFQVFVNHGFQVFIMDRTVENLDDHAVFVQHNGVGIAAEAA